MSTLRGLLYLIQCSFRRQLRSKKTSLSLLFLALIAAVIYFVGLQRPWTLGTFGEFIVLRLYALFYLPVVTLMYGTGALGDDRDEKSLVYVLTRPIPRSLLFTSKLLAVLPQTLLFGVGGLAALWAVALARGTPDLDGALGLFLPGVCLSALAYVSFFHFLGALFRHSTLLAVAYLFFVEVLVGRIPGIMKRVSISFYTWSVLYEEAAPAGLRPSPVFFPISAEAARIILISFAVGFLLLGAWVFSAKEYREVV